MQDTANSAGRPEFNLFFYKTFICDIFYADSTTSEQTPSPQTTTETSRALLEEKQQLEEKPSASSEPVKTTGSSPTGKLHKRDRRKRKRPPKINMKDATIRAAGDESYDSSELSEIEVFKSKEGESKNDKAKEEQDVPAADAVAFPVCGIFGLVLTLTTSCLSMYCLFSCVLPRFPSEKICPRHF